MGESGSGRQPAAGTWTHPQHITLTVIKKDLNWKGWRDQYNAAANNYKQTNFPSIVLGILKNIEESDKAKHVKTVVIDTINGLMVAEEMRNLKVQGYGKWSDLASYIWEIIDYVADHEG